MENIRGIGDLKHCNRKDKKIMYTVAVTVANSKLVHKKFNQERDSSNKCHTTKDQGRLY